MGTLEHFGYRLPAIPFLQRISHRAHQFLDAYSPLGADNTIIALEVATSAGLFWFGGPFTLVKGTAGYLIGIDGLRRLIA